MGVHSTQFAIRERRPVRAGARAGRATPRASGRQRPLVLIAGLVAAAPRRRCARPASRARRLPRRHAVARADEGRVGRRAGRALRGGGRARFRWSASTCRPRSAASRCRRSSGAASPRSTTSSPSRSRPSTATARSTWCAAWSRRGAEERVTLYTGNDDHIVLDLLVPFAVKRGDDEVQRAHPRRAARPLERVDADARSSCSSASRPPSRPGRSTRTCSRSTARVTDCNSAFFDVAHDFAGCIPGCHEVLRRQGLLEGIWCLDPKETLSPGQAEEIDRVCREHADLVRRRLRAREPGALAGLRPRWTASERRTCSATRLRVLAHLALLLAWYLFVQARQRAEVRHAVAGRRRCDALLVPELRLVDQHRGDRHRDLRRLLPRRWWSACCWRCCSPGRRRSKR